MLQLLLGASFVFSSALSRVVIEPHNADADSIVNGVGYDEHIANHSLMFAYAAYQPQYKLMTWTCNFCQAVPGFEMDDLHLTDVLLGYTGYDPNYNQIVAVFRGSVYTENWISNADFIQTEYPGVPDGKVHKGFYNAWKELQSRVLVSVDKLMKEHSSASLLVVGHSLGAAMAQIGALDIFNLANTRGFSGTRKVYTFGSPRWGNGQMAAYFKLLTDVNWRVVNMHDRVPTVPFGLGYTHTSTQVWYKYDVPLIYTLCNGSGEDPACAYSFWHSTMDDHNDYLNVNKVIE